MNNSIKITMRKQALVKGLAVLIITMFIFSNLRVLGSDMKVKNYAIERTNPTSDISDQNIILTFGQTTEEKLAVNTLLESFPNARIVNYFANVKDLSTIQNINNIYIVGHGVETGIQVDSTIISYDHLNSIVSRVNSNGVYYLACNSFAASEKLQGVKSFGFMGLVEPELGAMLVAYITGSTKVSANDLIKRLAIVSQNPNKFSTLNPYYGPDEKAGWARFCMQALVLALFTATYLVASGYFWTAIVNYIKSVPASILQTLGYSLFLGVMLGSIDIVAQSMANVVDAMVGFANTLLSIIPWWYYPVVASAVVVDLAFTDLALPLKTALVWSVLIGALSIEIWYWNADINDPDDFFEPL